MVIDKLKSAYRRAMAVVKGDSDQSATSSEEDLLDRFREEFRTDLDADEEDREEAEADNKFANAGDKNKEQWEPAMKAQRIALNRPVVQRNLIPTYVQQVVNEGNQNNPSIKITAADGGAQETAEYLQGRIRHTEYESDSATIWGTARDQQVTSSRGFIRLMTEYEPGTFKQKIKIERIANQFSVVWAKAGDAYDCSDKEHVWIVSKISKGEHIRRFGKETTLNAMPFTEAIEMAPDWIGVSASDDGNDDDTVGDLIQIAERFSKKYEKRRIVKLSNGYEGYEDEMPKRRFAAMQVVDEREEDSLVGVVRHVVDGVQILAGGIKGDPFLVDCLPIVPVWGREAMVGGVMRRFSLIRQAKDMQRSVNFYCSNITELIGMVPKTPWLIEFGSIPPNHEGAWNNISNEPRGFVYWIGRDPRTGHIYQKPSREVAEPPIQALSLGLQQSIDGIKAAMGIFDASLGERSNENSGIAIQRRQIQSGIVNYHFPNNEARSRKRVGEILLKMIKKLDVEGGEYQVRDYDGSTRFVPVGKKYYDEKAGKDVTHDLNSGNYGVEVEQEQKFTSAKEEENVRLAEVIKAAPELLQVIGDQWMRTSSFPGSGELADRMKAWIEKINPGIIPPDQGEGKQLPPQVRQLVEALQQEVQAATQQAEQLNQQIETKQPELELKLKIATMEDATKRLDIQVKADIELAKLGNANAQAMAEAEAKQIETQLGYNAEQQATAEQHVHEATQADADRQHQLEQAENAQLAAERSQESAQQAAAEQSQASEE